MTDFIIAFTLHGSVILLIDDILLMITVYSIIGVC